MDGAEDEVSGIGDVQADLALVDEGLLVLEHKLGGVFERDDVGGARLTDLLDHGGDGGAFSTAGDARDEDESLVELGDFLECGREVELFVTHSVPRDVSGCHRRESSLAEDVDAEAVVVIELEGEVRGSAFGVVGLLLFVHDFEEHFFDSVVAQGVALE